MRTYKIAKKATAIITDFIQKQVAKLANLARDLREPKTLILFLLGAFIRFSLAPFTEHRWDMYIWRLNQALVYQYQINPFWPQPGAPLEFAWGYPPLWLFVLLLIYPFHALLSPISYPQNASALWNPYPWQNMTEMFESYRCFTPQNLPLITLINKTPIIIADLLIALVLYKIVKSTNRNYAFYSFYAWLLNPLVIWISSIWGMFDSIPTLFVLLSLHFILTKKYNCSAISLATAVLFKLYPIVLIPVMSLVIYKIEEKKQAVKQAVKYFIVSSLVTAMTIFLVYLIAALLSHQEEPLGLSAKLFFNLFLKRSSPDWMGQNVFQNLTPLIFLNEIFNKLQIVGNIPVSPLLMGIALVCIMISILKNKTFSKENVIAYTIVTHFSLYLTYAVVNEQNLVWVLPLLLFLAAYRKSIELRYLYWAITLFDVSYMIYRYDLSYFMSPYFLPEYIGLRIPVDTLILGLIVCILYVAGIKLAFRKSDSEKKNN